MKWLIPILWLVHMVAYGQATITTVPNSAGLTNTLPSATRPAVAVVNTNGTAWSLHTYVPNSAAAISGEDVYPTKTGIGRWLRTPYTGLLQDIIVTGGADFERGSIDAITATNITTVDLNASGLTTIQNGLATGMRKAGAYDGLFDSQDSFTTKEYVDHVRTVIVGSVSELLLASTKATGRTAWVTSGKYSGQWLWCETETFPDNGEWCRRPTSYTSDAQAGRWMYAGSNGSPRVVPTIADLLSSHPSTYADSFIGTNLVYSATVEVLGFSVAGKGGGTWWWNAYDTTVTNTYNYGAVRAYPGISTGRWNLLIKDGVVTSYQWGAVGDGVADDSDESNALTLYQESIGVSLRAVFEPGTYKMTRPLLYGSNARIYGSIDQSVLQRGWNQIDGEGKAMSLMRNRSWVGGTNAWSTGIPDYDTNIFIYGLTFNNPENPGSSTNAMFQGGSFAGYHVGDMTLAWCRSVNPEKDWSFTVKGNRIDAVQCSSSGPLDVYEDGFHILGGEDINVIGGSFGSGDDSIAMTASYGNPLRRINIVGARVDSYRAFGIKIAASGDDSLWTNGSYVGDINITGVTGKAGWVRNGAIALRHDPIDGTKHSVIRNVTISNTRIEVGPKNATNAATWASDGGDSWGIAVRGASNVVFRDVSVAGTTYRDGIYVENSQQVEFHGGTWSDPYDTTQGIVDVSNSTDVTLDGLRFESALVTPVSFRSGSTRSEIRNSDFTTGAGFSAIKWFNVDGSETARVLNTKFHGVGNGPQISTTNMASLVVLGNKFDDTLAAKVTLYSSQIPTNYIVVANDNYDYTTPILQSWVQNTGSATIYKRMVRTDASQELYTKMVGGQVKEYGLGLSGFVWSPNETDATDKPWFIGSGHYTNAEKPFGWIRGVSSSTANGLYIGGGTSSVTAATFIDLIGAANNTTATGTAVARVTIGGVKIQTGGISGAAAASADLEVDSTTGGILFPRMTGTQRDAISSIVDGLVIYNTTDSKLQVRAGGAWVDLH